MSNPMSSMQTMPVDEMTPSHQNNSEHDGASKTSTRSCCDEIVSFTIGCSFLVPQYACIDSFGDSLRVLISDLIVQSISLKTLTPPPKA